MKWLFLLTMIVVASTELSQVLLNYKAQNDMFWERVKGVAKGMLSGDELAPAVNSFLATAESQVCDVKEDESCDPATNWIMGCSCTESFGALNGSCANTPCTIVRHVQESGAQILRELVAADNYQNLFRVILEQVELVWRGLCECRSVVDATLSCAPHYDGLLLDVMGMDFRDNFDSIAEHMDWKSLSNIVYGYLHAICGQENGEDCLEVFKEWQIHGGVFFDNSFNGDKGCMSMARFEKEFGSYMAVEAGDKSNSNEYFSKVVESYMVMEESGICAPDCVEEMQKQYYGSCCIKRAGERLSSPFMKQNYVKLLSSVWGNFFEGQTADVPTIKAAIDRFFSMYRPEEFCGDTAHVFNKMNRQCDAKRDANLAAN